MRDDFTAKTKQQIAKRAGYLCSNPECRGFTIGPKLSGEGFVNMGVAGHITAASPGGPRYDSSLTSDQRKHHSNGIWLCQNHGKLVDSDEGHFTVEQLRSWKKSIEDYIFKALLENSGHDRQPKVDIEDLPDASIIAKLGLSGQDNIESVFTRLLDASKADLSAFKRMLSWPQNAISLNLVIVDEKGPRPFQASGLAVANGTFNEIAIVAPPGTGKTTTLLQISEAILNEKKSVAVFIPLSEWSSGKDSLLESLTRRLSYQNARIQHFMLLAHHSRLTLILDGWNELNTEARRRANNELKALRRDFPSLRIIISTRQRELDIPVFGPVIKIDSLTEKQQQEIAFGLRGKEGEEILDHVWRTRGIRELVTIPLYLTALISKTSGNTLPTTKEEVLRMFVTEHEQDNDKVEPLREQLLGFHRDFLTAIAVEATNTGSTTIPNSQARTVIKQVEDRLIAGKQITSAPQPSHIIDTLVSLHMLVQSVGKDGGVSFQHHQFQEWYASFMIEELMLAAIEGDQDSIKKLKGDILNIPVWEESILFTCERLSRGNKKEAQAVSFAILETLAIDPILAAEMIYRSTEEVWVSIKDTVLPFIQMWHKEGKLDRAVIFMISSGRNEFAPEIWSLITNEDTQVHLPTLRAGRRFRPSVLGPDIEGRIAKLSEELREHIISEIASESEMDGIELATKLSKSDKSPQVQVAVIESLLFRRADRFVTEILDSAPEEVWKLMAQKGYAEEIADPAASERLLQERKSYIETEKDSLRKINMLLNFDDKDKKIGKEIESLIASLDLSIKDQNVLWSIDRAHELYPENVVSGLVKRLESGKEIPFRTEKLIQAKGIIIEDGPLADLVLNPKSNEKIAAAAVSIVGPKIIRLLINQVIKINAKINASDRPHHKEMITEHRRLCEWIENTNPHSFMQAILEYSDIDDPEEIAMLANLIARHGDSNRSPFVLKDQIQQKIIALIQSQVKNLLSSANTTRAQMAEMAQAIERIAVSELAPALLHLLEADLERRQKARKEWLEARQKGRDIKSDQHMCWSNQYKNALEAIGDQQVVETMKAYLPHIDFGIYAASILKSIWKKSQPQRDERLLRTWPDFSMIKDRQVDEDNAPFVDDIIAVIGNALKDNTENDSHRHALKLATVAFSMPYGNQEKIINTLLQLPLPPIEKRDLLTVLVLNGETINAKIILEGIDNLLEEAKTKQWMLEEQNGWRLRRWLELLPFSDHPASALEVLKLLDDRHTQPYRLRSFLTSLRYARSEEAEYVVIELAKDDPRFLTEYDWLNALTDRNTITAARAFLELICNNAFIDDKGGMDAQKYGKKLAAAIINHPDFRTEVYKLYETLTAGPVKSALEYAMTHAPDINGIMILFQNYAEQGKRFEQTALYFAIRSVTVGERPSADWTGTNELYGIPAPELRKRLFEKVIGSNQNETRLAIEALTAIDEIRDDYGAAESEPRHPDINSGQPWPLIDQ